MIIKYIIFIFVIIVACGFEGPDYKPLFRDRYVSVFDYQIQKYVIPDNIKKVFISTPGWKEKQFLNGIERNRLREVSYEISKKYPDIDFITIENNPFSIPSSIINGKAQPVIILKIDETILDGTLIGEVSGRIIYNGKEVKAKYHMKLDSKANTWIINKEEILQ